MVKIITIHGTNAGADSDHGEEWWQRGSPFQSKLAEKIADRIEFEPFHWSGANSERERRSAGVALAKRLSATKEPVIIMGHSHGGSVALHALFLLFKKSPQKAIETFRSLITVGTPMIRYSGARNPIFRFNIVGQLFLIYAFLIGGLTTGAIILGDRFGDLSALIGESVFAGFIEFEDNLLGRILQVFTPAILTTTVLPFVILNQFTRRSAARNRAFASNKLWREFRNIYAPLNHTQDEAIAALKTGAKLDLTIADRKTVQSAIFVPLALILAGVLGTRTASEIVDVESLRALVAPEVEERELEEDLSGFVSLGLRDPASKIRSLSGDVRTEANDRAGLMRQTTVFLRDDYVVLDLATAVRARSRDDLVAYLENLRPTEVSGVVNYNDGRVCSRDAIYLTLDGQAALVERARALGGDFSAATPAARARVINASSRVGGEAQPGKSKILAPNARDKGDSPAPTQIEDVMEKPGPRARAVARGLDAQEARCRASDVMVLDGGSAMEALLAEDILVDIADDALFSSRPELVELTTMMTGGDDNASLASYIDAFLVYPELRRGEAIVFERSTFNDAQVACFLASTVRQAKRFSLGLFEEPERLTSLKGLCDQVEGQTFTLYDVATAVLAEVEYHLENLVQAGGDILDKVTGTQSADENAVEASDYLEFGGVQAGILSPFYFVFSALIVAWSVAWALSFVLAPMLSGIFNELIRSNVFGNDGHGEKIEQVAPGLDFSAEQVGTLPQRVEREIDEYVRQFTSETIERLRDLISLQSLKPKGATPLPEIAETLTWKELLHTAYFDVDSFIDHTADTLAVTAGLRRKN
ncbi:MAG: hypothetical protein AAFX08_01205 [Pseudomonadota bacterium]